MMVASSPPWFSGYAALVCLLETGAQGPPALLRLLLLTAGLATLILALGTK
jgi:hypothetical protein